MGVNRSRRDRNRLAAIRARRVHPEDLTEVDWTIIRRALEVVERNALANGNDPVAVAAHRVLVKVQRR